MAATSIVPSRFRQWGNAAREDAARWLDLARVWTWGVSRLECELPVEVVHVGRRAHVRDAAALLGISARAVPGGARLARSERALIVSELPLPGAARVPLQLRVVVDLRAPVFDRWDPELRRRMRKLSRSGYSWALAREEDAARVHAAMLVPFALARHADDARHVTLSATRKIASRGGLHLLLRGREEIGAHLGYAYERRGLRVLTTLRFGYPAEVYGDLKAFSDANAMNVQLALEHAKTQGYDAYDIGPSLARPDDGLLQFKRRRHGALSAYDAPHLWFRFPREGTPELLCAAPLFTDEGGGIALHVGVTRDTDDASLLHRFKDWRFMGLRAVRVHAARKISEGTVRAVRALYHDRGRVEVEVI